MAENSKIEWTTHTFQAWEGCQKVSDGCKFCYAEERDNRYHGGEHWGPKGTRKMMSDAYWKQPLKWDKAASDDYLNHLSEEPLYDEGELEPYQRPRVFCASLADVFEDRPELHAPRLRLFELIRQTPHLDWLLLTKRPENILPAIEEAKVLAARKDSLWNWLHSWFIGRILPANVWLGTSVENQEAADKRIPELLKVPAVVRFLSCEPLLGPVALPCEEPRPLAESFIKGILCEDPHCARKSKHCPGEFGCRAHLSKYDEKIDWVIAGGESGPNARPFNLQWARGIVQQCQAVGVSVFVKQFGAQWYDPDQMRGVRGSCIVPVDSPFQFVKPTDKKGGNWDEWPDDLKVREFPTPAHLAETT